jgi:hypothetical protein
MSTAAAPSICSIGWDVGGWNCDKNGKSRDALVILDCTLTIVGKPWRGNLRECIASAGTTRDWLKALFAKCGAVFPEDPRSVTMAIDTPLGVSDELVALITRQGRCEPDETSGLNRYLFRYTERHLFQGGWKAKFAPQMESCGVWTDGAGFRAIETYPTACRGTKMIKMLLDGQNKLKPDDLEDARISALVAHLFTTERNTLEEPDDKAPHSEGWIWVPRHK